MDQNNLVIFKDLVDDTVVASRRGVGALELAYQRSPELLRVLSDRPEDCRQGGVPHLIGEPVEATQSLSGVISTSYTEVVSDLVPQPEPLALGCLSS